MFKIKKAVIVACSAMAIVALINVLPGGRYCPVRFYRPAEDFPPAPPLATLGESFALPMFGRKYDMNCSICHVQGVFPRLNDVGYRFRRAGFRMPEEIGQPQDKKFEIGDYFSAAAQDAFVASSESDSTTGERNNQAHFEPGEFVLFPLTGSLGKYWATQGELSITTEGEVELENSNARFVFGKEKSFFSAKAGVFHALEGYGASDRPIGLHFPLFMETPAESAQDTLFTMVEPSLLGLEAGYTYKNSSLSATLTNSLRPKKADEEIEGSHFFGEGNSPADVQVVFNQILGSKGSGVTFYYYTGSSRLPQDPNGFTDGTNEDVFKNRFHRGALFGTFYPWERFAVLAGAALGRDHLFDSAAGAVSGSFTSWGLFGELNWFPMTGLGLGARYDFFDPAMNVRNTLQAGSAFVSYTPVSFFQAILDYQYRHRQSDPTGLLTSHNVVTRIQFLY
jgi:hypothetical protein